MKDIVYKKAKRSLNSLNWNGYHPWSIVRVSYALVAGSATHSWQIQLSILLSYLQSIHYRHYWQFQCIYKSYTPGLKCFLQRYANDFGSQEVAICASRSTTVVTLVLKLNLPSSNKALLIYQRQESLQLFCMRCRLLWTDIPKGKYKTRVQSKHILRYLYAFLQEPFILNS